MQDIRARLAHDIGETATNPLAFVRYAFPWNEGELTGFRGPDTWQQAVLEDIQSALKSGKSKERAICEAVASGHGIGKSALVAWLILWAMATCPDTKGVITANTESQLKTKTWAELAKWHRLCICGYWFDLTATALISKVPGHDKTWRIDQVPWSERNTEAFAGLHNKGKRVLLIFDEASAIPDSIWEVSEGAMTDENTEILWCVFGNPTRNTGRFKDCFGRFRHRWNCRQIDSRTAAMTNHTQINAWIEDYGEDSDFVRVRVKGEFPRAGNTQFIPSDIVANARARRLSYDSYERQPRIIGVDVARFGDDSSVITKRQGLMCHPQQRYHGIDLMRLADIVSNEIYAWQPDGVFVDGAGVGGGVIDRLRQLGFDVVDVQAGARALDHTKFMNRRAEMWSKMREWLQNAQLPDDPDLEKELTGIEYGFSPNGLLQLEKKEDMKKRGLASPDGADSLAATFYAPVVTRIDAYEAQARINAKPYDPLDWKSLGQDSSGW